MYAGIGWMKNKTCIVFVSLVLASTACTNSTQPEPVDTATTATPSTSALSDQTADPTTPDETNSTLDTDAESEATTDAGPSARTPIPPSELGVAAYPIPGGSRPHDVAPALDGGVWYTAQGSGELGWLDPDTGETRHVRLGVGSRPHGVVVDMQGIAWVTDSGLNAIVSIDPSTNAVVEYPLPPGRPDANLNTAAFDAAGRLWFTGQNGIHGVLDPETGEIDVFDSPRGRGPYGIAATPLGEIYYASLAGSYVGLVSTDGAVTVLEPPTDGQGARRVWADSHGDIWVSEWNSGQLSRYTAIDETWTTWPLPGSSPRAYAVYVDDADVVWVSDFGGNSIHRFDPTIESFHTIALPSTPSDIRQILGRPGEVWGAESAADQLVVIRTTTE